MSIILNWLLFALCFAHPSMKQCTLTPATWETTIIAKQQCITTKTNTQIGLKFLQNTFNIPYTLINGFRRYDDTLLSFNNITQQKWYEFASGNVITLDLMQKDELVVYTSTSHSSINNMLQNSGNFKCGIFMKYHWILIKRVEIICM
eukprot:489543_1